MKIRLFVSWPVAALLATVVAVCPAQARTGGPSAEPILGIVIDCSGSMGSENLLIEAKHAATLACAVLHGRVVVVGFSDVATVSPVFDLDAARDEAIRWIESLTPLNRTRYVKALEAVAPLRPRAILFLSDGAPDEDITEILEVVRSRVGCPIHAVAVKADTRARDVLGRMAGLTHGGFYSLDQASQIVDVFLGILGHITRFRRYDMTTAELALRDVEGEVMAVGFDTEPGLGAAPERLAVALGRRTIHVARVRLAARSALRVTAPGSVQGRRAVVLRFDRPVAEIAPGPVVLTADGHEAKVNVAAMFRDPAGRPVDPRGDGTLRVTFEAVDPDGRVLQSIAGTPAAGAPALEATLTVPVRQGAAVPFVIRGITDDHTDGVPFRATANQVVVVDPAKAPRATAVSATATLRVRAGKAGERLGGVVTITASGGTPEVRRAFLEALKASPPVVAVRPASGPGFDTTADPQTFEVATRLEGDTALIAELSWPAGPVAGVHEVEVRPGKVGGIAYQGVRGSVRAVAVDAMQLLVVAHRGPGRRFTVFDSWQTPPQRGVAVTGDPIGTELVRGPGIDPREFASLGHGLRVLLVRADGSAENVPLAYQGDRYVTELRTFPEPGGVLVVRVDVAVEGFRFRLDGEVRIEPVRLALRLTDEPAWVRLGTLPQGTVTPLALEVDGTVGTKPAPAELVAELCRRDGLRVRWSLVDGAGEAVAGEEHAAEPDPWRTTVRLPRPGAHVLRLELAGEGDRVRDAQSWRLSVVDSPVRLTVVGTGNSSLGRWLPGWFLDEPRVVVRAAPAESPLYSSYHLAGLRVAQVEAPFLEDRGLFETAVTPGSTPLVCLATMRPYAAVADSLPELRVEESLAVTTRPPVRPVRVALGVMGLVVTLIGTGLAGYHGTRLGYRRRLEALGHAVVLLGSASARPELVVGRGDKGWPSPEVLICTEAAGRGAWAIRLVRPEQAGGKPVLARVRQHLDGSVRLTAVSDLPGLAAGCSRQLGPGEPPQAITPQVQLALRAPSPSPTPVVAGRG